MRVFLINSFQRLYPLTPHPSPLTPHPSPLNRYPCLRSIHSLGKREYFEMPLTVLWKRLVNGRRDFEVRAIDGVTHR